MKYECQCEENRQNLVTLLKHCVDASFSSFRKFYKS